MTLKFSKYILLTATCFTLILSTSCRKEEIEFEQAPPEETLVPNSEVANLMQRTAMNDGSIDNIIDNANCFTVQLPVTVIANGTLLNITSSSDYDSIENVFDAYDDDNDSIEIQFPITIVLYDFSQVEINSMSEFTTYASNCNGENEMDDDIECVDFQYPIAASIFNTNNELISSVTLNGDEQLYNFINEIDLNDIVSIDFPITIVISDGTSFVVNSLTELATTIENHLNDCDEDDDYDYNDDDCSGCSPLQLVEILTTCSDWKVDKLERNDNNYDDIYDGYLFNFYTDGTISVYWDATTVYGTWSTNGTGNNLTVDINIPSLPYCNLNWSLHEIEQGASETKIDLHEGDDDRLRYYNNCN